MFVSHLVFLLAIATMALRFSMDLMKISFALPFDFFQSCLDFRKRLNGNDFCKGKKNFSKFTMINLKAIYNFCQFDFAFNLCNLFNSVYKDWSISLRRFSLLEGAQQLFLVLFPQKFRFRDSGHSFISSVLVVEMDCLLRIIKEPAS